MSDPLISGQTRLSDLWRVDKPLIGFPPNPQEGGLRKPVSLWETKTIPPPLQMRSGLSVFVTHSTIPMKGEFAGKGITGTPQEYLNDLTDPEEWFNSAEGLAASSYLLWQESKEAIHHLNLAMAEKEPEIPADSEEMDVLVEKGGWCMNTSLMLIGLALENALKGKLIEEEPETTEITAKMNANGELTEAKISQIAGSSPSHDLHALAEKADLFDVETNPVVDEPQELERFRGILAQLTHNVVWSSRYPVPNKSAKRQEWMDQTPSDTSNPITAIEFYTEAFDTAIELVHHITPGDEGVSWQKSKK